MLRAGGRELHAPGYHAVGCDLRVVEEVRRQLEACGASAALPTLALAECVLVYLRPSAATALLQHLAATFPRLVLLVYEQCNLADRFGAVMVRNLQARGCGLAGARQCGAPGATAARLAALGFERVRAWDMGAVWRALPEDDRARAEALEMLDETELLHQLHAHYAITVASRGELFADMDLNAS